MNFFSFLGECSEKVQVHFTCTGTFHKTVHKNPRKKRLRYDTQRIERRKRDLGLFRNKIPDLVTEIIESKKNLWNFLCDD